MLNKFKVKYIKAKIMSKKNKNDSLFESINGSELAALSGGGSSANGGNSGDIGHMSNANVTGGKYKTGDGGKGGQVGK
jgi:hypothetical protein